MEIKCKDCQTPFEFSEGEESFLREKFGDDKFKPPVRCKPCREINKQKKSAARPEDRRR